MTRKPSHTFSAREGYHAFLGGVGSFEVLWMDEQDSHWPEGWYWQACFPGCLPDGEPLGPFNSSTAAWKDARS